VYGDIPQECIQTVIVPICKNKNGNISGGAGNSGGSKRAWVGHGLPRFLLNFTFQFVWLTYTADNVQTAKF